MAGAAEHHIRQHLDQWCIFRPLWEGTLADEPATVVDARIGDHGPALLTLEDGSVYPGVAWGAPVATGGDLVVNTSQTGYQEVCTDPSYAGQVVVMTYPLIGNYGVNPEDVESHRPFVEGFIVKEDGDELVRTAMADAPGLLK